MRKENEEEKLGEENENANVSSCSDSEMGIKEGAVVSAG